MFNGTRENPSNMEESHVSYSTTSLEAEVGSGGSYMSGRGSSFVVIFVIFFYDTLP